jgi:hypothetical protein
MMPEGLGELREQEAWVHVENTGTGPAAIEKLLILGGVPNPTLQLQSAPETGTVSGIFNADQGRGEADSISIEAGNGLTLFTNSLPFSFQGDGVSCSEDSTSHQFTVELVANPSTTVSREFTALYTPESESDGCAISIELR